MQKYNAMKMIQHNNPCIKFDLRALNGYLLPLVSDKGTVTVQLHRLFDDTAKHVFAAVILMRANCYEICAILTVIKAAPSLNFALRLHIRG